MQNMATIRRPRQGGGRHPPPLAPTVSSFKPRAQWSNAGSSIFLYVNLPGFYRDQIDIKIDEKTRTIQIQGQRPLSAQTKARFNEAYRVPESCDITKSNTSFSHGLLTIEFPKIVEAEKSVVQDQGKTVQRPEQEESNSLGRRKPSDEEKRAGTSQEKSPLTMNREEPRTYKSVVEGKKPVVPQGSRERSEKKVKEGEAKPSLGRKEQAKEEKVVERKEVDRQKTRQKSKEEEVRSTPTHGDSLKGKVLEKEEKVTEKKRDGDISQKVKEGGLITRTPSIGGSLEPNVHGGKAEKVVERKADGEIGQKVKEERKIGLGQKKEETYTEPVVGNEAKGTEKETAATNQATTPELKPKQRVERRAQDVDSNVKSKNDEKVVEEDKVSEGDIQQKVEEVVNAKDNPEVSVLRKVDSGDPTKEESSRGGPLLIEEGQKKTDMDPPPTEGRGKGDEESKKYDFPLVNVGVAALVIMVFGAYVCVPLVKMFY